MRARLPDRDGLVTRDGVNLAYEIYGDAPDTMLFIPPWSIVHSRIYKAQFPYFSERFRCITYDGRGNGKSDRPDDVAAYSLDNYLADALAVMDALDVEQAILVGLSFGGLLASILAAHHPERVRAAILAGTITTIGPPQYARFDASHFTAKRDSYEGWDKFNHRYWLKNYPDFAEFFIRNLCNEPHSTKQIEDGIGWATETNGPTLLKTVAARSILPGSTSAKKCTARSVVRCCSSTATTTRSSPTGARRPRTPR
jgi:pimeloyl-ACP methyl ester carboxylesterase